VRLRGFAIGVACVLAGALAIGSAVLGYQRLAYRVVSAELTKTRLADGSRDPPSFEVILQKRADWLPGRASIRTPVDKERFIEVVAGCRHGPVSAGCGPGGSTSVFEFRRSEPADRLALGDRARGHIEALID